ncbi:sugar transferase [Salipaludibacillus aurantiacus]|uniref:Exopolysaccharide biosynthesis polyprenyl glycosylphosphotransferase n=1 Tax=Salipaludibacillus aurantiacus TaxID=1601833 RepID=A0A1H9X584_9BACI|nr:sugar transferase [Salipaludibacillus aurantiacus]SES41239.1 exopolysaccharide biosynthesis polyprenyl glycosylphosphotransferase [Salipaludibacillus aurantiacus]
MTNMGESRNHKFLLITGDLLCILIAYISAFYVRYFDFPGRNWDAFIALLPWILLIGLFFISVYELYNLDRKNTISDIVRKILVATALMTFLTMAASYLFREFAMPRSVVLIAAVFTVILMVLFKVLYLKLTRGHVIGKVLLIGDESNTAKLIDKIKHPMLKGSKVQHIPEDTTIEHIDYYLEESDYVVLCTDLTKEKKSQVIYHAMERNKVVYVIPTLYELLLQRASITPLEDTLVMGVKPFGLTWDKVFVKRVFDFVASAILLLLISPVLLFVAIIVKLEDPKGSVIYSQERLGKNDKPFTIYKFRSMITGAEKLTGPVLASSDDNRITKVGRFIRSTRLDELPQLFNVLKGDMSLVGPRPEREFFIKELAQKYYHYGYRNRVQPGITGYAQVMGKYSTEVEDKLRFDLYYIRNYSLWLDIIILLKTFLVIFDRSKSEGAEDSSENNAPSDEQSESDQRDRKTKEKSTINV